MASTSISALARYAETFSLSGSDHRLAMAMRFAPKCCRAAIGADALGAASRRSGVELPPRPVFGWCWGGRVGGGGRRGWERIGPPAQGGGFPPPPHQAVDAAPIPPVYRVVHALQGVIGDFN